LIVCPNVVRIALVTLYYIQLVVGSWLFPCSWSEKKVDEKQQQEKFLKIVLRQKIL